MYSGMTAVGDPNDPNVDPVRQQLMRRLQPGQVAPQAGIPSPTSSAPGTAPAPPKYTAYGSSTPGDPGNVGVSPIDPSTLPAPSTGSPTPLSSISLHNTDPSALTPATIAQGRANYPTPQSYLDSGGGIGAMLSQGFTPQGVADYVNKIYGLQSGSSVAYDPSRGEKGIYEMPGGGYYSFDNGQWAFHQTGQETNASTTMTPFLSGIRDQLLARMHSDQRPVDPNDPEIADPFNAARNASDRSLDQERKANAEAAFAQSGGGSIDTNALNTQQQQAIERSGTNLATLRSGLVAKEYTARRADLDAAMQQALASGDAETARQVQLAISQLNAQIQREGLGVQLAINTANQNANTTVAGG